MIDAIEMAGDAVAHRTWRTENPGSLLYMAADLFIREKLRIVAAGGFSISEAQAALFQNVDRDGTRLTTIAARAGTTKQSMLELIAKAEAMNFVARRPDPRDGRARIIVFTPMGTDMLERLRSGVLEAERRMAAQIGKPFLAAMKRMLSLYVEAAGSALVPADDLNMSDDNAVWRRRNVGRLLLSASRAYTRDVLRAVHAGGFERVTEVQLTLFRNLDLAGTRLTEIASRGRVTKQAMIELVDKAAGLGLVTRHADPVDRRAKIVRFTPSGLRLLESARLGVMAAERRMASITGDAFAAEMTSRLKSYVRREETIADVGADRSHPVVEQVSQASF